MVAKGRNKVTSPKVAKIASNLLRKSKISKVKKVSASDLAQAGGKRKKKKK